MTTAKTTPHSTSKHGLIGLTQEAALDFAAAVAWLLSDAASSVTGHSLIVDGELSIPLPSPISPPRGHAVGSARRPCVAVSVMLW